MKIWDSVYIYRQSLVKTQHKLQVNNYVNVDDVQQYWNLFEKKLIKVVDYVAPLVDYHGNLIIEKAPKSIKNKINKRNRLTSFLNLHKIGFLTCLVFKTV